MFPNNDFNRELRRLGQDHRRNLARKRVYRYKIHTFSSGERLALMVAFPCLSLAALAPILFN